MELFFQLNQLRAEIYQTIKKMLEKLKYIKQTIKKILEKWFLLNFKNGVKQVRSVYVVIIYAPMFLTIVQWIMNDTVKAIHGDSHNSYKIYFWNLKKTCSMVIFSNDTIKQVYRACNTCLKSENGLAGYFQNHDGIKSSWATEKILYERKASGRLKTIRPYKTNV